jgi:23S rRNA (cytosine1962-C5)-methyltransferase
MNEIIKNRIPGLVMELFGEVLFLNYYVDRCDLDPVELKALALNLAQKHQLKSVWVSYFEKNRFDKTTPKKELLTGELIQEWVVTENDLNFKLKVDEGFSRGIFLDQKENRKLLADKKFKKILNCFSYTCAFGVYCAKSGAITYNVDLSKKYLEWGKENYQLNNVSLEGHYFYARDVFEFLKKTDQKFDLIILDPPSFSRSKEGRVFSVEKDYQELLRLSKTKLEKNGSIFFSSNLDKWNKEDLKRNVQKIFSENILNFEESDGKSTFFQFID